jgi:uncharacterized protein YndB with AHSA1/START domain
MLIDPKKPIVWRAALAASPDRVFGFLDTDAGRERFWAERSRAISPAQFELTFAFGPVAVVEVLERLPPTLLRLRYFGADAELRLQEDGAGTLLSVSCLCPDPGQWVEFHAGWVSWLLVLKARIDHDVDLRNGRPDRGWDSRFVDQ